MATREQFQIAQDIVRFANIIQDSLNSNAYMLKRINPETGSAYVRGDGSAWPLEELKDMTSRNIGDLVAIKTMIDNFVSAYGRQNVANAITSFGLDVDQIVSDITAMWDAGRTAYQAIPSANSDSQLASIGDALLASVPPLRLVRRSWNLG